MIWGIQIDKETCPSGVKKKKKQRSVAECRRYAVGQGEGEESKWEHRQPKGNRGKGMGKSEGGGMGEGYRDRLLRRAKHPLSG